MIYTSIMGEKDAPRDDIKVFTDRHWVGDDRMEAKIYKIVPHKFFTAEYSVWVDGNIYPKVEEEKFIELLDGKDIAVFRHPERNDLFDEAQFCIEKGKDNPDTIKKHIERYAGLERPTGLYACGVIVRKHTPRIKELCEKWWDEIRLGSSRDQISFPYVFPKDEITVINENIWSNDLVDFRLHLK